MDYLQQAAQQGNENCSPKLLTSRKYLASGRNAVPNIYNYRTNLKLTRKIPVQASHNQNKIQEAPLSSRQAFKCSGLIFTIQKVCTVIRSEKSLLNVG